MTETFNPKAHLAQISRKDGKGATSKTDYLPVKWQLRWLRDEHPEAHLVTELVYHDPAERIAIFRAEVSIPGAGSAIGTACKMASDRWPNYCELCETAAIGRALRHLGYGTELAAEFDEGQEEDPAGEAAPTPTALSAASLRPAAAALNRALLAAKTPAALKAAGQAVAAAKENQDLTPHELARLSASYEQRARLLATKAS